MLLVSARWGKRGLLEPIGRDGRRMQAAILEHIQGALLSPDFIVGILHGFESVLVVDGLTNFTDSFSQSHLVRW